MRASLLCLPLALAALTGCGLVTGSAVGVLFSEEGDLGLETDAGMGSSWSGNGVVCLGSSDPSLQPDAGLYTLSGRVTAEQSFDELDADTVLGNLVPCDGDVGRVMTIEAENGEIHQLGYAWRDPYGYDATPWPSVELDRPVRATVRQGASGQTLSAGMAVFDARGDLVYALEAGRGEPGLVSGDIDDLVVRADREVTRTEDESCGMRVSLALDFSSSSDELSLFEGEDSSMMLGGETYVTCSIASYDIEDCEGEVGEVSWVMFR